MRNVQLIVLVSLGMITIALGGCRSSLVTENWGNAHRANIALMVENPNAGDQDLAPVDPDSLTAVMDGYYYSQQPKPVSSSVPSIIQIDAS